ncbi:MAG: PAS domain S-box protein [Bacteroidales bacterium]|nr:PAS domain S-box protein [Bacteroidales bacterium]
MIDTENGQILDVNPAATAIYGYSREELLRMKNTDVSAEPEETSRATNRNDTRVHLRFHKRKDGSIFPVELSAGFTTFKNKKIQIVTSRDITENKKMQDALLESEIKYRSLIENATDGIVIAQDGILKFANQAMCDIMRYPMESLINKPYLDFVVPDNHQTMIDYHNRRMVGENFTSIYRSQFIRSDKKIITVELNARTSEYNGNSAAFIIIRDITERINTENELKKAKEELEQLNSDLEDRIIESSRKLAETSTQLLNLQKENLQSQFEVLRQQVNPHFLFNSLNVLTSLIKLEPDLAEQFTEHLSMVYRYVLEIKITSWLTSTPNFASSTLIFFYLISAL